MEIETVSDLANVIADWIGVYGACKDEGKSDGCEFSEKKVACCRVGFTMHLEERIREAVENDKKIEEMNLRELAKQNGA
jgi:hypothetical protein